MRHTATIAGVLAMCGAASAAQFDVRSADTSSLGSPLTYSGTLFQVADSSDGGPGPNAIDTNANNAFDSYIAIEIQPSSGGTPAKGDGFQANPGDLNTIGSPFVVSGQVSAVWFMNPSGPRPLVGAVGQAAFGNQFGLFLGRFSFRTTNGTTPTGSFTLGTHGVFVDVRDAATLNVGSPQTDSLLVKFTAFNTPMQVGLDGGSLTTHPTANQYFLAFHTFNVQVGNSRYLVNDLYVVMVPGPGGAVVGAFAGMIFTFPRRRR